MTVTVLRLARFRRLRRLVFGGMNLRVPVRPSVRMPVYVSAGHSNTRLNHHKMATVFKK